MVSLTIDAITGAEPTYGFPAGLALHQHCETDGERTIWRDVVDDHGISWRFEPRVCATPLCRRGGYFSFPEYLALQKCVGVLAPPFPQ